LLPNPKVLNAHIAGRFYPINATGIIVVSLKDTLKKNWIFFLVVALMFFADRTTKHCIINFFLDYKADTYYFNPFLNFVLVWNTGMAFGLFESDNYIYHILSFFITCVIVFLFFWLFKSQSRFEKMSISLVIGGALGNLYDRIIYNAVPDFIDLHYLDFHWFVFNVSDIVITFGIILLLLNDLFSKKNAQ
jgi:signal peptidase II